MWPARLHEKVASPGENLVPEQEMKGRVWDTVDLFTGHYGSILGVGGRESWKFCLEIIWSTCTDHVRMTLSPQVF